MANDDSFNSIPEIDQTISTQKQKIHIRIKQRNGKKSITTIEGLGDLNLQLIIQEMKNKFGCNGTLQSEKNIMLFGDQRNQAKKYLIDNSIVDASNIVIHGY